MFEDITIIVSLFLALVSTALTFLTYFSPHLVLSLALKSSRHWERVPDRIDGVKIFRHRILSGYTIEIDLNTPITREFYEPWLEALWRPDESASTYYVTLLFNGTPICRELFLNYDGNRNFMPLPAITEKFGKYYYGFSKTSMQLAEIVGDDYFDRTPMQVAKAVTQSRYNPSFSNSYLDNLDTSVERLGTKIKEFKSKCKLIH